MLKVFILKKTSHPCQFPEALVDRLILALSNENDVVLDPFLGSGTTAVSCLKNNRKCIGSEIKKEYMDIITKRLQLFQLSNYQKSQFI